MSSSDKVRLAAQLGKWQPVDTGKLYDPDHGLLARAMREKRRSYSDPIRETTGPVSVLMGAVDMAPGVFVHRLYGYLCKKQEKGYRYEAELLPITHGRASALTEEEAWELACTIIDADPFS